MRSFLFCFTFIFSVAEASAQNIPQEYYDLVDKAYGLYTKKSYLQAAQTYSEAFKANGWKGLPSDRYNAACSWALAKVPDSAFFQLERIATKGNYTNYGLISTDRDLKSLHTDKRWLPVLELVKQNKEKAEANFDHVLIARLDSIYKEDQQYRLKLGELEKNRDKNARKLEALWKVIHEKDSINLLQVKTILDQHGWLGADVVGQQGNSTLFLVIQHSDQETQEHYLPMMREAVKQRKAAANSLALLEDRVALGQGKKQVYGSQIGFEPETNTYFVMPLEDPDRVDQRRAEVGLGPLAEYISYWQLKWDVEQYKKDLPALEEKQKARHR